MIVDSADLDRSHFMLPRDPANVRPNSILDLGVDPIDAVLRAEHNMVIDLRIRICHRSSIVADATAVFNTRRPWVETHGYIQASLRDRGRTFHAPLILLS